LDSIEHVKQSDFYYPSKTATIVMDGSYELKQSQVEKALSDRYGSKYTIRVFWKK
jgi:hypothetical protein